MNQEEDILELSESKEIDCILNQKGNIEQNKMKIEEDNTKKFKFNLTVKDTLKTSLNNFLIKLESFDRKLNNIRMTLIGKIIQLIIII
ncbi:hypothetical protein A0H76_1158 [Hepatospora eriocheir]|uniref:Uncharacterized protein n=1 Tax=Hepatospora eriocheir TaxID=1081669 RepID=A0A1X0QHJ9_9MICR|nr:hypothetical protein A0H76_1158 [Hepatospora eriocheir]